MPLARNGIADKLKAEKIEREKAEAAMPKPEPAEPEPVRYGNGPQVDLDQQADRLKALWKSGRDKNTAHSLLCLKKFGK